MKTNSQVPFFVEVSLKIEIFIVEVLGFTTDFHSVLYTVVIYCAIALFLFWIIESFNDLASKYGNVSPATIGRAIKKLGYTYKKKVMFTQKVIKKQGESIN